MTETMTLYLVPDPLLPRTCHAPPSLDSLKFRAMCSSAVAADSRQRVLAFFAEHVRSL